MANRQNKSQVFFIKSNHFYCHITTARALVSEVDYEVGYETLLQTLQQKYLFSRMYIRLLLLLIL